MQKIINLTPHEINIYDENNRHVMDIKLSGLPIPRCQQKQSIAGFIGDVTITRQYFGVVENLPEREEETFYIVSRMVADALPGRGDLLVPGPLIRDEKGNPYGCKGLSVVGLLDPLPPDFGKYKPDESYISSTTGNETNIFHFGNGYGASVVRGEHTYGGDAGFWEVAVLRGDEVCSKTPITDDVIGWLTDREVVEILSMIEALK